METTQGATPKARGIGPATYREALDDEEERYWTCWRMEDDERRLARWVRWRRLLGR
ncbi:hypothetical protein HP550_02715 [Cellulomonas humilata]|uniref:Uncharacterized protein n=1 Tax=Cellulomonas humilata TaxID=144055 RepID=A0A7Y6DW34_9CELL|nr:hypothetical protein [Cellulomonas humilata]NUU16163.1 hypothetical protein [Cellulomonas humilata]